MQQERRRKKIDLGSWSRPSSSPIRSPSTRTAAASHPDPERLGRADSGDGGSLPTSPAAASPSRSSPSTDPHRWSLLPLLPQHLPHRRSPLHLVPGGRLANRSSTTSPTTRAATNTAAAGGDICEDNKLPTATTCCCHCCCAWVKNTDGFAYLLRWRMTRARPASFSRGRLGAKP
uniref:Uncharacterized protein n=1 Tax=Oryza glumipatula TaxID=40148 RepID=A0A0E0BEJ9_9ORYZ